MSQLATIYRVSALVADQLDRNHDLEIIRDTIFSNAKEMLEFQFDGFSLVMAAEFLNQNCHIPVLDSSYNWIAESLAKTGGAFFFLDYKLCKDFSGKLQSIKTNCEELDRFYEVFNETTPHGHGEAMQSGIELYKELSYSISGKELLLISIQ